MTSIRKFTQPDPRLYDEIERHDDWMVSFTYHPPTPAMIEELKNTETYRGLMEDRAKRAASLPPANQDL